MSPYIGILRPVNSLMAAIAVLIGSLLVNLQGYALAPVYLAMLIAFLISGAGMAINDYFDAEVDRINRSDRPIPSGRIGKKTALAYSIVLFLVGIVLAGFINWVVFAIAVVNSVLLILYSYSLKSRLLLGSIIVSYSVASTFIFGSAAALTAQNIQLGLLLVPFIFGLLAFLANLPREIVKTFEDIEGDRQGFLKKLLGGAMGVVARFGFIKGSAELKYKKLLAGVAIASLIAAIIVSPVPYLLGLLSIYYIFVLWIADLLFALGIIGIFKAREKKQYHKISKKIKIGMLVGLIAFLVGLILK